ncbi:MAG: hypothetical protein J6T74_04005 [Clostridia bacterium]|nr:hypothetical protein [Clostridia bacterium]
MEFDKSKTKENLVRAFVSECIDGARYQFMAKDAKAKGYGYLYKQMKLLATNEMAHASVFYDFILCEGKKGEKCKKDGERIEVCASYPFTNYVLPEALNLTSKNEEHESAKIYKEFEETALNEGFKDVAKAFHHVVQVENCHYLMLEEYYTKMMNDKLYTSPKKIKWKCSNCGTEIEDTKAPSPCPLCSYEQGYYMIPTSDE